MSDQRDDRPARRPDYKVLVKPRDNEEARYGVVGAAWKGGSPGHEWIRIQLDPGVALRWDDGLMITLFESEDR